MWTLTKCPLTFVTLYSASENRPKLFCSLHLLPLIIKSLCFQQPPKPWRNDLITSLVIVRLPSSLIETIPWGLSHSIIGGRIGQKLLFSGNLPFFRKLCFQQPPRSYRIDFITTTVLVKKPWGPLQTILWGLWHSIIREKGGRKLFLTGNVALFFQKICFQQPLKPWRNDRKTSTVKVKKL